MRRSITSPFFYLSCIIFVVICCLMCMSGGQKDRVVSSVYDGDTFTMSDGERIRMAEIDAPEQTQAYGDEAREYLIKILNYGHVRLKPVALDKYKRTVCQVYVGNIWVNELMVKKGLAWAYEKYSSLYPLQREAQGARIGLWSQPHTPPWMFRKYSKLYR